MVQEENQKWRSVGVHLNFVKTQKLNAFRQEARGKRQESGKRQEGKRDALDKKSNIRYFYKYGMLPSVAYHKVVRKEGSNPAFCQLQNLCMINNKRGLRNRVFANNPVSGGRWRSLHYFGCTGISIINSEPSPGVELQVRLPPCFSTTTE